MLTINADQHPLMNLFHKPTDEKRMVVILDAADHDAWLSCSVADAPRLFRRWSGELLAETVPRASQHEKEVCKPFTIAEKKLLLELLGRFRASKKSESA